MIDFFALAVDNARRQFRSETAAIHIDGALDNRAIEKPGPHQCCADFAIVTSCDGDTDQLWCGVCDRRWAQPCSVGDFVPAVET